MSFRNRRFPIVYLLLLFSFQIVFSQQKIVSVKEIQALIDKDSLAKAKAAIAEGIAFYRSKKNYDSLYRYIPFEGSFKLNNGNKKLAIKKAEILTDEITKNAAPHFVVEAITELGWLYDDVGQHQKAYDLLQSAAPY